MRLSSAMGGAGEFMLNPGSLADGRRPPGCLCFFFFFFFFFSTSSPSALNSSGASASCRSSGLPNPGESRSAPSPASLPLVGFSVFSLFFTLGRLAPGSRLSICGMAGISKDISWCPACSSSSRETPAWVQRILTIFILRYNVWHFAGRGSVQELLPSWRLKKNLWPPSSSCSVQAVTSRCTSCSSCCTSRWWVMILSCFSAADIVALRKVAMLW
mmetsp:Transcript_80485/g.214881  ORF Transcript_80485/g.214881 Transcript_80485/m.214881 type:complete len:215 (-) Transcript_80485:134-778(-)